MSSAPALPAWVDQYAGRRVWTCWGWRKTKAGKITKPPLLPSGALASSTDPGTWVTLKDALLGLERGTLDGLPLAGIGIVLTDVDTLFAFDMDHCYDAPSGKLAPWAHELLAELQTYSEVTPSGAGIRAIGTVPPGWRETIHSDVQMDATGGHCELFYRAQRYITLTGTLLPGAPEELADVSQAGADIIARLLPHGTRAKAAACAPADETDLPPPTSGDLQEALWKISPEVERGEWVRAAAALKFEGGDACRKMFLDWSAASERWGEENAAGNAEELWDGLAPNGGVGYGTLIHLARTHPRKTPTGKHVPLPRTLWRSPAVRALPAPAKVLLVELYHRHTGSNNGRIRMSQEEAQTLLGCSRATVTRTFKLLHDAGLVRTSKRGRFTARLCNEYRLTKT